MKLLITSCGRHDLLNKTLKSFLRSQKYRLTDFIIHEDSNTSNFLEQISLCYGAEIVETNKIGQHASIEKFLNGNSEKYYVHSEDDWRYNNTYDWIKASIELMEADPTIIKVIARRDMLHPVTYNKKLTLFIQGKKTWTEIEDMTTKDYDDGVHSFGYLEPWSDPWNQIIWHGFSWNPGVTRRDLLHQFVPFPKKEEYLAKEIFDKGFKVVALDPGVYTHIGEGRSTHE